MRRLLTAICRRDVVQGWTAAPTISINASSQGMTTAKKVSPVKIPVAIARTRRPLGRTELVRLLELSVFTKSPSRLSAGGALVGDLLRSSVDITIGRMIPHMVGAADCDYFGSSGWILCRTFWMSSSNAAASACNLFRLPGPTFTPSISRSIRARSLSRCASNSRSSL